MPQSVTRKASLAMWLMQCESATDSKVWMGEDINLCISARFFQWPSTFFAIPQTITTLRYDVQHHAGFFIPGVVRGRYG